MTPEAAEALATAQQHLSDAKAIRGLRIGHVAAREAWLAAFHAAEAFIHERTGRPVKTHSGLRTVFSRLAKLDAIRHERCYIGADKWDLVMSSMQAEVFEAFRSIDIPEDKALKAATALGQRDQDVASLKSDMSVMKWMMGFVLAFQVAIFAKLFIH